MTDQARYIVPLNHELQKMITIPTSNWVKFWPLITQFRIDKSRCIQVEMSKKKLLMDKFMPLYIAIQIPHNLDVPKYYAPGLRQDH